MDYWTDKIWEEEMGGKCNTRMIKTRNAETVQNFNREPEREQYIDGRITLICILNKQDPNV
jgi:hypothetical protein